MEQHLWDLINSLVLIIFILIKRGYKYNPHPPGEAQKCEEHTKDIVEVKTEVKNITKRLDRMENKFNGKK